MIVSINGQLRVRISFELVISRCFYAWALVHQLYAPSGSVTGDLASLEANGKQKELVDPSLSNASAQLLSFRLLEEPLCLETHIS